MKSDVVELLFSVLALFVGGALEELLPKPLGVGFPILLVFAFAGARRASLPSALLFAVAAGAFVDALSRLPVAMTASFLLVGVSLARWTGFPWLVGAVLAYPLYQLWLVAWVPDVPGSLPVRVALAVPVGAVTACAAGFALRWAERGLVAHEGR